MLWFSILAVLVFFAIVGLLFIFALLISSKKTLLSLQ